MGSSQLKTFRVKPRTKLVRAIRYDPDSDECVQAIGAVLHRAKMSDGRYMPSQNYDNSIQYGGRHLMPGDWVVVSDVRGTPLPFTMSDAEFREEFEPEEDANGNEVR